MQRQENFEILWIFLQPCEKGHLNKMKTNIFVVKNIVQSSEYLHKLDTTEVSVLGFWVFFDCAEYLIIT